MKGIQYINYFRQKEYADSASKVIDEFRLLLKNYVRPNFQLIGIPVGKKTQKINFEIPHYDAEQKSHSGSLSW